MSFANPDVFTKVPTYVGRDAEVSITKNDAGYNQWSGISDPGEGAPTAAPTGGSTAPQAATRVTGSNYETPAERAAKQVYIVKQSSISAAIALAGHNKEKATPQEIVATAQAFVDYVFDKNESIESLQSDVI